MDGCHLVDDFACPASFPWHTAKHVTRDPAPLPTDFNQQDYNTLVAHPSPFQKYLEAFLCLVGLKRRRHGYLCFYTCSGSHQVAPARAESKLEASVDRLFDEGGNQTEQGDSVSGGKGADIQSVSEAMDTVVEDVAPLRPRRQRKQKTIVVDTGEPSHPAKRLREDHETPGGKSMSAMQRLLAGAVLNSKVRATAASTLPFVTDSVSTMQEREGGDHTDSVTGLNLLTIGAPQRFVISSYSSHHSGANVAEAEVDSVVRSSVPIMTTVTTNTPTVDPAVIAKEKPVEPSPIFAGSSSAGGTDPAMGVFSDLSGSDFLVGGIRTVIDPDTDL
ncbi:hypothetical protein Tco_1564509 [Tanacetum coccineum]